MSKSIERMVLERALELMRQGWCEGAWAENTKWEPVRWYAKDAVRFCAEGAIRRATKEVMGPGNVKMANRIIRSFDKKPSAPYYLLAVNEECGKKAVLLVMCNRLRRL